MPKDTGKSQMAIETIRMACCFRVAADPSVHSRHVLELQAGLRRLVPRVAGWARLELYATRPSSTSPAITSPTPVHWVGVGRSPMSATPAMIGTIE